MAGKTIRQLCRLKENKSKKICSKTNIKAVERIDKIAPGVLDNIKLKKKLKVGRER